MAWILQTLFIIVMATTASKCKHNNGHADFPQYEYEYADYSPIFGRSNQPSYPNNPTVVGRSITESNERANERSFSAHSGTQRIQEQERRRIQPRVAETAPRTETGSYKILNYPSLSSRRGDPDAYSAKDVIVFPGPTSSKDQRPDIPEECLRVGICDDVPNYPTEEIKKALSERADIRDKLQIDQLDISDVPDITQRLGPSEEERELCYFDMKVSYPKGALDKDGNLLYILNDEKNPLQGVKVEVCNLKKNNGTCNGIATFPPGYSSRCLQKHVTRKLWAYDRGVLVERAFQIPSCCSCVVKTTLGL